MWRSSSKRAAAGFTLVEVLVVLASLGMILWMAGELLFPMRQAAERQRMQVEARQAARSAADYAAYVVRGATDMNDLANPRNPAAIISYLWRGANPSTAGANFPTCPGDAGCVQMSYNNVDQAATSFASAGSDIVTLTVAQVTYPVLIGSAAGWPIPFTDASLQYWAFDHGCTPGGPSANAAANDTANFAEFKALTQDVTDPSKSHAMIVWDPATGAWLVYRITNYRAGDNATSCTVLDPNCVVSGVNIPCVKVNASPQDANSLNPPGGDEQLTTLPNLVVGSRFLTLRVCNGWLEQKSDVFDPNTDNNCPSLPSGTTVYPPYVTKTGWSPLLPNVEDFQVAYIYGDGTIWNRPGATLTAVEGCDDGVPQSNASPTASAGTTQFDIRRVVGLRVTVTGRSSTPVSVAGVGKIAARPPAAEDHDTSTLPSDTFYRYQVSTTVMMRNRITGI
jgi:prepilin-type N-terminal cleavage/methylation domain-containing protein